MIALGLLVVSLAILLQTMSSAAVATREAEYIVTATQLAQEKLTQVRLKIEKEGVTDRQITESGDFKDFGDEQMDLQFGDELQDYHYEWSISQIDIGLAGDIASLAGDLQGQGLLPSGSEGDQQQGDQNQPQQLPSLASLGISNQMISQMLGRYIREVRVRVWWGDDSDKAHDDGDEVVLTTHVADTAGSFINMEQQGGGGSQ